MPPPEAVACERPPALAQAEANPPAIASLDLRMPRVDGYEPSGSFRPHPAPKGVVPVARTGWGQPEDDQRTKAAGFNDHLVKPVI
jgi:CheY-like chemotaxis protein